MVDTSFMKMNPAVLNGHIANVKTLIQHQDSNMDQLRTVVQSPALMGAGQFYGQSMTSYQQLASDWENLKVMLTNYHGTIANHMEAVSTTDAKGAGALQGGSGTRST